MKRTLRAAWRILVGCFYRVTNRERYETYAYADGYCPRCDGCGVDECCPSDICDGGRFCARHYSHRDADGGQR